MTNAPAEPTSAATPAAGTACYVYGIVPEGTRLPEGLRGVGDPAGEVTVVRHGRLAAIVSEVPADRPLGTRDDLLAHERVLDMVAAEAPVLPMRFGAVLTDVEAAAEELLAPHHDHFASALFELAGSAQFTVKGRYVRDTVLREVLAEEPEVARLREALRDLPEEAGYYDRIRLGELIAHAFARKRETDAQTLLDTLTPHAVAVSVHEPPGEEGVVDVSFLVDHERQPRFERALEELGQRWDGRVRLRLLGPIAPYDFVGGDDAWA